MKKEKKISPLLLPSGGDRPQVVHSSSHIGAARDGLDRRVEGGHGRVQARRGGLERGRGLHGGDGSDGVFYRFRVRRRARDGVVRLQVGRAGPLDARGGGLEELRHSGLRRERGPSLEDAVQSAGGGARGGALQVGAGRGRGLLRVLDAECDLLGGGASGPGDAGGLKVVDGLLDLAEVGLEGVFFLRWLSE